MRGQEQHDPQAVKAYYQDVEKYDWVDVADHFRGVESIFHRKRERVMKRLMAKYSIDRDRCLDVGCGTGLILRHLPANSIGLDISSHNLETCAHHVPTAQLIQGDAENLPFVDGSFSLVICTEVLEHLPNPSQAVAEIGRCLTRDGVLIGSVPHRSPLCEDAIPEQYLPKTGTFPQYV